MLTPPHFRQAASGRNPYAWLGVFAVDWQGVVRFYQASSSKCGFKAETGPSGVRSPT